jgi:hypothetical protein
MLVFSSADHLKAPQQAFDGCSRRGRPFPSEISEVAAFDF